MLHNLDQFTTEIGKTRFCFFKSIENLESPKKINRTIFLEMKVRVVNQPFHAFQPRQPHKLIIIIDVHIIQIIKEITTVLTTIDIIRKYLIVI